MAFLSTTHPAECCARPARRRGIPTLIAAWRSRRDLAHLDDAALRDIGITREEALLEARRPIWDLPDSWDR